MIWTTRRGAALVTLPKWWTSRLEMAIATTAIATSPPTPPVRPWISHHLFSLGHTLRNLLITLVSKENFQVSFQDIIRDGSFLGHCLKYRAIETHFRVVFSLETSFNDITYITWLLLKFGDFNSTYTFCNKVSTVACRASSSFLNLSSTLTQPYGQERNRNVKCHSSRGGCMHLIFYSHYSISSWPTTPSQNLRITQFPSKKRRVYCIFNH